MIDIQDFYNSGKLATAPIFAQAHDGDVSAIVMGDFYDGGTFPSIYNGVLFVGDLNEGYIDALTLDSQNQVSSVRRFASDLPGIVYIETGTDGNLYYVDLFNGEIGYWQSV